MSALSFRVPAGFAPLTLLRRAFYASWGRIPRRSEVRFENDILTVAPDISGTGTMHVPLVHKRFGIILHSTDTLLQRSRPYLLLKELGRGELGKLHRRLFEWQMIGFIPSPKIKEEVRDLTRQFGKMATSNENALSTEDRARELIPIISDLGIRLTDQYVEQMLAYRNRNGNRIPVPLGTITDSGILDSHLETSQLKASLRETFQMVAATPTWRELEPRPGQYQWDLLESRLNEMKRLGLKNVIGPLISFEASAFPDWVLEKVDEQHALEIEAIKYVKALLEHFAKRSDYWILSNRIFSCPQSGFSIGRGVALVCELAKEIRREKPTGLILVGIDQPWGDYYRTYDCPLPLVAITESLASVSDVDGFIMEFDLGLSSRSSLPRDPMLFGRLIDLWCVWGKQLFISFSVPSELGNDPKKTDDFVAPQFEWNAMMQQEWTIRSLQMFLTKKNVRGFFWNQLIDPPPILIPEELSSPNLEMSGLVDWRGIPKPVYHSLTSFRKSLLF